jgi:DNA-binding GntR family transcriptional regulator
MVQASRQTEMTTETTSARDGATFKAPVAAEASARPRRSANNVRELYSWVRAAILNGKIGAGEKINQARLAAELRVSRTPLREALRMLQAEGLVVGELNQRMYVTTLTPEEIDSLYAERILLEAFGLMITVPRLDEAETARIQSTLKHMNAHNWVGDRAAWELQHNAFHGLLVMHVRTAFGPMLADSIANLQLRAERYRRSYVNTDPHASETAAKDHVRIVAAIARKDVAAAVEELSHHFARTAFNVLAHLSPDFEPQAVKNALSVANKLPSAEIGTLRDLPELVSAGRGAAPAK